MINTLRAAVLAVAMLTAHFIASVRGYLQVAALNGPAGGWVGRLFVKPNKYAYFARDTKPFVQVWETNWPFSLTRRYVTFHGVLSCDAAAANRGLPGWRASIQPDRYSTA
jgi:hypothetical protein